MADLTGVDDASANPLTPNTGPVPPTAVKSDIPDWFSPTSWLKQVGNIPGDIESWFSKNPVINVAMNPLSTVSNGIEDVGQTIMSTAENGAASVGGVITSIGSGINNTVTGLGTILKWLAIALIALTALYLLSTIKGVGNVFGAKT